jgi:ribonuclease G
MEEETSSIADLEAFINKSIKVQAEAMYSQAEFDVVFR